MTRLIICGQAPSRVGDGRPFDGPSGSRLAKLLGLMDSEQLREAVTLTNIFSKPAERLPERGDVFPRRAARVAGDRKMSNWAGLDEPIVVIACGHAVYHALTDRKTEFFRGRRWRGVEVWCFPHPSGASAYWNDRDRTARAGRFLRRLIASRGIELRDDAGEPILLD